MIPLHTRSAHPGDIPYVLATWIRSYGRQFSAARRGPVLDKFRHEYVDRVMAADPHIVMLCSPEKHSALHGYSISTNGHLAWVYVAKDLRRNGYAREAITSVLRGYPDRIVVNWRWPFESTRFVLNRLGSVAA